MAKLHHKEIISANRFIITVSICIGVLFLTVTWADARSSTVGAAKLTIYPAKAGELDKKYQLMVNPEDQVEGDAVALYEKAVKLIPKDFNQEQIREWLKLPVEQFPQKQAEQTLQKYLEPLKLTARATRCKECKWPEWKPGDQPKNLTEYRKLAYIIELWARLEISQGSYEGAVLAIRTGFETARDLGQGPTIIQGLVGTAIGGIMCREVKQYLQGKDLPNLYHALAGIPRPLIDIEAAIENEKKVGLASVKNKLLREQIEKQMASSLARTRLISKRLVNNLNGLQCVEAIRDYAAAHEGQLPDNLSDINQVEVPKDLVSGKEFEYHRTDKGATLQSAIPEGGNERDAFHYEITLKK
jgi:hypothetical protein